ncbi:MAG TPA: peptidylprolyl isomerase [Planctomycetota bacterium]|jgi:parvulin-like peptidyl-prolyl isomerase|nr:peptidylprolyl isomerase [Planctomycetota bacterium]
MWTPSLLLLALPGLLPTQGEKPPQPPAPAPPAAAPTQEPPPLTLPPGVAATINGTPLSMDEYRDFLWMIHCKQNIRDLVAFKLLEEEAAKYGITVTEEEVRGKIAKFWDDFLNRRHGGDRAKAEKELREMGFTSEIYDRYQAFQARKDLLQDRIVQRTRVVTDDAVKRRFDQKYGVDGVKVEVRQIFLGRAAFMKEEVAKGKKPSEVDQKLLDDKARDAAFKAHERLKKGEDFGEVAREISQDPAAKQSGGVLPNYNYDRYGEEFSKVVRALKEGEFSDPFPVGNNWHLVQVLRRTTTPLEKVRETIFKELTEEAPGFAEKNELYKRVYESATVVLW